MSVYGEPSAMCLQQNYKWIDKIILESGDAKNVLQLTLEEDALFQLMT